MTVGRPYRLRSRSPSGRSAQERLTAQRIVPSVGDDARRADTDAEDRLVRAGQQVVDQIVDDVDGRVAIGAVEVARDPPAQLTAEVDECASERPLTEVEGDDVACVVDERHEGRRLATGARAPARLSRQALLSRARRPARRRDVRVSPVRRAISAREIGPRS